MSPEVTAFSVAVVSPFPPKFMPPDSFTVNGFAEAHTASVALPSSVGAVAVLATTSVLGGTACRQSCRPRAIRRPMRWRGWVW